LAARSRHLFAAASAVVALRIVVACSTSREAAPAPEAGPPGEAFTACEIQGYASETEAGTCPDGTCPALAFDTNGARVPCCTSIVSGPAMCFDGAVTSAPDGGEAGADGGGDDADESDADESDAAESGTDAANEAAADTGNDVAETGPLADAADGE
jgi:hypothetical protein